jgi:hypothetical protein
LIVQETLRSGTARFVASFWESKEYAQDKIAAYQNII